jgi:hypothetical protein
VTLRAVLLALVLAGPVAAQDDPIFIQPLDDLEDPEASSDPFAEQTVIEEEEQAEAELAPGGVIRTLDKIAGTREDLALANGETGRFGLLSILMSECRYPAENPEGDAYAHLVIRYNDDPDAVFSGWMIASSPALSALDNRRYDVWVLRCNTASGEGNSDG